MVGSMVYEAALPAGHTKDPSVSVSIEIGAYPADTPTAEPEEHLEGLCGTKSVCHVFSPIE